MNDSNDTNGSEVQGEKVFALFLRQPYANDLSTGFKSIEIRSHGTSYRGEVLVCSTPTHEYPRMQAGCSVGIAELYDIKPVAELTDEEWNKTRVPRHRRKKIAGGYAWFFRNQQRIIEYPVRNPRRKVAWIDFIRNDIFAYPTVIYVDRYTKI